MNGFKYTAFSSLLLMIFLLVIATFFEKMYGSFVVQEYIYHSPLFIALWVVTVLSAIIYIIKDVKRPAVIMLHFAFALVLLGALVSFLTSRRGEVELSLNTVPSSMFVNSKGELEKMPFRLSLLELTTSYDSDLLTPLDYNAVVEVADKSSAPDTLSLSMNNPLVFKHHTFCIKSVVPDSMLLYVSYDPYGLPLTYSGYFLVLLSFVLVLVNKESRFRRLLSKALGREEKAISDDGFSLAGGRKLLDKVLLSMSVVTLIVLTVFAAHRWYSTGLFPATNGYEAMFLLAWCSLLFAIVAWRRSSTLFRAMFTLALLALSVALLSYDSAGSVIPPILRTPLLGLHVSCMILSYSLLGCTAVNAVVALCYGYIFKNESKLNALANLGRLLLYPATILLAAGIFIGAVWANISWGRYWGWDPKEVWALITMLVCSFTFHTSSLPLMAKPLFFHIFSIVVFLLMLFTYFGVNYFLGGFHSYV